MAFSFPRALQAVVKRQLALRPIQNAMNAPAEIAVATRVSTALERSNAKRASNIQGDAATAAHTAAKARNPQLRFDIKIAPADAVTAPAIPRPATDISHRINQSAESNCRFCAAAAAAASSAVGPAFAPGVRRDPDNRQI